MTDNLNVIVTLKDNASKGIESIEKSTGSFTKAIAAAALAVAALAGAIAAVSVKEFAAFEKQMSAVKAITGAVGEDFADLNKLAKEMGATTAFTAQQAGEAMQFLGMAGFTTDEIMQSLAGTMNLAAAGQLDLGAAADISSNILTAFRLEADEMNRVVDVMAKTVTSSNTNIIEMGEAMKFLAPTASALGISLEEASAMVGFLANAGLKGGVATRAFSASLVSLANPTKKATGAMEEIGLKAFDVSGEFVGMAGLLKQLESGMAGFTDQQQQATLSQIFGAGSMKVMNSLLAESSDEFAKYTETIEDSQGAAQAMADTQLDNLAGSMTLLKSAASGLAISIGEVLAPGIRSAVEGFTKFITKINESGVVVKAVEKIALVYAESMKLVEQSLSFVGTAALEFSKIMFDRYSPAVISASIATKDWAVEMVNKYTPAIKGAIDQTTTFAQEIANNMKPQIEETTKKAKELATELLNEYNPALLETIQSKKTLSEIIADLISNAFTALVDIVSNSKNILDSFGVSIVQFVGFLGLVFSPIRTVVILLLDWIRTMDIDLRQSIINVGQRIKFFVQDKIGQLQFWIQRNKERIVEWKNTLLDIGKTGFIVLSNIISHVITKLGEWGDKIVEEYNKANNKMKENRENFKTWGDRVEDTIVSIGDTAQQVFDFIGTNVFEPFIEGLMPGVVAAWENLNEIMFGTELQGDDLKTMFDILTESTKILSESIGLGLGGTLAAITDLIRFFVLGLDASVALLLDIGKIIGTLIQLVTGKSTRKFESSLKKFGERRSDEFSNFSNFAPASADFFSNLQGRATGGTVSAGTPYMVGERGAEMFTPSQNGRISPSRATGGVTINIQGNLIGNRQAAMDLGNQIASQLGLSTAIA